MLRKSSTDTIALRVLRKYRESQKECHCVFEDLEAQAKRRAVVVHEGVRSNREVFDYIFISVLFT